MNTREWLILCFMDFELEKKFRDAIRPLAEQIGEVPDLESVIFLIGVQELGQGVRNFKKDEKLQLMHIAVCTLLEPYGYYRYEKNDTDGWPHFKNIKPLPLLNEKEQKKLMKEAVIDYFAALKHSDQKI